MKSYSESRAFSLSHRIASAVPSGVGRLRHMTRLSPLALLAFHGAATAQILPEPPEDPPVEQGGGGGVGLPILDKNRSTTTRISETVDRQVDRAVVAGVRTTSADRGPASQRVRLSGSRPEDGLGFDGRLAAWASGSATFLDSDARGARYDGDVLVPKAGADYTTADAWVFGLSVAYEDSDLDTQFDDGSIEGDGFLVTPYLGHAFGENLYVDAGLGYGRLSYDRARSPEGTRQTGSFDGDRFHAFVNVTGVAPWLWHGVNGLTLAGRTSFRYSTEEQDAFTERTADGGTTRIPGGTVELGQVSIGAEARYRPQFGADAGVEVYLRADGNIDVVREDRETSAGFAATTDDDTDVALQVGAVATITEAVSAEAYYQRVFSRQDLTDQTVSLNIRIAF